MAATPFTLLGGWREGRGRGGLVLVRKRKIDIMMVVEVMEVEEGV